MPAKTAAIMPAVPVTTAPTDIVAKKKSKAPNMTNVSTLYRFIQLSICFLIVEEHWTCVQLLQSQEENESHQDGSVHPCRQRSLHGRCHRVPLGRGPGVSRELCQGQQEEDDKAEAHHDGRLDGRRAQASVRWRKCKFERISVSRLINFLCSGHPARWRRRARHPLLPDQHGGSEHIQGVEQAEPEQGWGGDWSQVGEAQIVGKVDRPNLLNPFLVVNLSVI